MSGHRTYTFEDHGALTVACKDCDFEEAGFGHSELAAPVARVHQLETYVAELEALLAVRDGLADHLAVMLAAVEGCGTHAEKVAEVRRLAAEQRRGQRLHGIEGGAA